MLSLGQPFPQFCLPVAISGKPDAALKNISTSDYPDQWKLYLFLGVRFGELGTVELAYFATLCEHFAALQTTVFGVSCDAGFVNLLLRRCREHAIDLPYPVLVDSERKLTASLGILSANDAAQRATFLVDPENVVRYISVHNAAVPRNGSKPYGC